LTCLFVFGCAKTTAPETEKPAELGIVQFDGRSIDLAPYLEGFPYSGFNPIFGADTLLFDHQGDTKIMKRVALGTEPPDLSAGVAINDIDWNSRTRWGGEYHAETNSLFFTGDESNDEKLNLFQLSLDDGTTTALTQEPYLYGWSLSPDETQFALVVRRGEGPYTSCLETMKLDGSDRKEILCDTPAAQFTWRGPVWSPDASAVIIRVNIEGKRSRANLAYVSLEAPELQIYTDPAVARTSALILDDWLDEDRSVVVVDDTGFHQLGIFSLSSGEIAWREPFDRDLSGLELLEIDDKRLFLITLHRPDEDWLIVQDMETGEELSRKVIDGTARIMETDDHTKALLRITSASTPFATEWLEIDAHGTVTRAPWFGLPEDIASKIVHCDVEAVTFPTHDIDPETGANRELHGFLYTPKAPLRTPAARIVAFYGGGNSFRTDQQIFCEAGIATLSPAVRGARGYGSAFYQLNDGDLGGDEIADLFSAARFLETRGYETGRIGVFGGSHGGYATMRAMTFPAATNELDDSYPFAFGISHAGFSNILTFYEDCNIPDWVILEAGDPATEADKLLDRSPISHAGLLTGPLMLTHGANDNRVPVRESRQMKAACDAANVECHYVEIEGQGHGIKGLANQQYLYAQRFEFLERVLVTD